MNPTVRKFDSVIFDLDGTLLDSLEDIATAANRVLAQCGFPTHAVDDYCRLVGDGVRVLFERALPADSQSDQALLDRCCQAFKREYEDQWHRHSVPYPGIPELLAELSTTGLKLAVLSNKPHPFTVACVEHFFAATPWTAVLGNREDIPRKPDPAGVHAILKEAASPPDRCLYLGDTNTDMQTARAAGCFAVGVTWGFRDAEELREAGAQRLIDRPNELLAEEILLS
jgi:phosphoglycolate phosphatase